VIRMKQGSIMDPENWTEKRGVFKVA